MKQIDWMEYLMWRSDRMPSCHPTFALVLYNHKVRNQLHKLGSVCLNTEDMDPNADIQELQNLWNNDDDRKKLQKKLYTFASNVPGTNRIGLINVMNLKVLYFFILISIKCI